MSNPLVHAERSAKKWGGSADDYLALHQWFDATKAHLPDNRHRMLLHNSFGMLLAEQVFGAVIQNSLARIIHGESRLPAGPVDAVPCRAAGWRGSHSVEVGAQFPRPPTGYFSTCSVIPDDTIFSRP